MNLRSSLRALALAGVCALPLPAGVLTFNFTETGGNVVVTASGSLTDSSAWSQFAAGHPVAGYIDPSQGQVDFGDPTPPPSTVADLFFATGTLSGAWNSAFGTGTTQFATTHSGHTLGFFSMHFWGFLPRLYLPSGYSFDPITPQPLSSTLTFTGANFTTLGITPGTYDFVNDGDTIRLTVGSGGGSSVPDAGPGPALALLLGGLGLRQWRSSRRARAAA
jgi:hypothetical protein